MTRRVWTPERLEQVAELTRRGWSNIDMAEHFGVSADAMRNVRQRYGLPPIRARWSGDRLKTLGFLRSLGWSNQRIAEYFGLRRGTIEKIVDRSSLKRGPYHRVTPEELELIRDFRKRGLTGGQVAIKLGWSTSRVHSVTRYYTNLAKAGKGPWR